MKLSVIWLVLLVAIFLACCKSPRKEIHEAFETVNKSLEESAKVSSSSVEDIYRSIKSSKQNNVDVEQMADTVYIRFHRITKFIDSLQDVLKAKDSLGESLTVTDKLMIKSPSGSKLRNLLLELHDGSSLMMDTAVVDSALIATIQAFNEIRKDPSQLDKFFRNTPTIGSITILSKIKSDCSSISKAALRQASVLKDHPIP